MTALARRTIYDDHVDRELAMWPGVTASRETRGKHLSLVLTYRGQSRFVVYPSSPGDSMRGVQNHLADVRFELRQLGAQRMQPSKRQRAAKRRHRPASELSRFSWEVPDPDKGPLRDPFAVLATLNIAQPVAAEPPTVADEQPRRMSLIERAAACLKRLISRANSPKIQRDRGA